MKQLRIKRVKPQAKLPTRATSGSAGYDLYACLEEPITIHSGEIVRVGTGIALGIDDCEYAAFLYARSGLATKFGIVPANCVGVVDSDYRGEVVVSLINHQKESFEVHPEDRIAQMVIAPVVLPELMEVKELDQTIRGDGGFGSTGVKG